MILLKVARSLGAGQKNKRGQCNVSNVHSDHKHTCGSFEIPPGHLEGVEEGMARGDHLRWTHSWAP